MEAILEKLYYSLNDAFLENLKPKEIFKFEDSNLVDILKTLMSLKKNNNDLNN